jgi:gliding motility-associated-like protein
VNGGPFTLLHTVGDTSVLTYLDKTAAYASNDYCYFIRAVSVCGEAGPTSDTLCTATQAAGQVNYVKQASVTASGAVAVTWQHFPNGPQSVFYLFRKDDTPGAKFELRQTLFYPTADAWVDRAVETSAHSYCYYLVNEDYCGNRSEPGNVGCTILLTGHPEWHANALDWTAYAEWPAGVEGYKIWRRPVGKAYYQSLATVPGQDTAFTDAELDLASGRFYYYVEAAEQPGGFGGISRSNEIAVEQSPLAFLPSGFTPNGDGLNDHWPLVSAYVRDMDLKVFNRWGQLVFESANKNRGWNGMHGDRPAPEGTYVFRLRYTGYDTGDTRELLGTVSLVR